MKVPAFFTGTMILFALALVIPQEASAFGLPKPSTTGVARKIQTRLQNKLTMAKENSDSSTGGSIWDTKIGRWLVREDRKTHPVFGTPFFRPELYSFGDAILQLRFWWFTFHDMTGVAQQVYIFLSTFHTLLIVFCDYGMPKPFFWNFPKLPLAFMGLFDYFILGANLLAPFLFTSDLDNWTRWVLPFVYGVPAVFAVVLFTDPNPNGKPVTTLDDN